MHGVWKDEGKIPIHHFAWTFFPWLGLPWKFIQEMFIETTCVLEYDPSAVLSVETSGCDGGMRCRINADTMEVLRYQTQQKQTNLKLSPNVWGSHCSSHYYCSQLSSVAQLCLIICNRMGCSIAGPPVHHQLSEPAQTHAHRVSDAIQPSHPRSCPSPPACNLPQHQGLFQWVGSSHQVAKVLDFQLQHQSFQWIFRTDFL